jgi:hypothetical protein
VIGPRAPLPGTVEPALASSIAKVWPKGKSGTRSFAGCERICESCFYNAERAARGRRRAVKA